MSLPANWGLPAPPEPECSVTARERRELRERAVSHAAYIHQDVGDAMVVFNRDEAIAEVLQTAEEFYQWIIRDEDPS